jgi:hypothetical protein
MQDYGSAHISNGSHSRHRAAESPAEIAAEIIAHAKDAHKRSLHGNVDQQKHEGGARSAVSARFRKSVHAVRAVGNLGKFDTLFMCHPVPFESLIDVVYHSHPGNEARQELKKGQTLVAVNTKPDFKSRLLDMFSARSHCHSPISMDLDDAQSTYLAKNEKDGPGMVSERSMRDILQIASSKLNSDENLSEVNAAIVESLRMVPTFRNMGSNLTDKQGLLPMQQLAVTHAKFCSSKPAQVVSQIYKKVKTESGPPGSLPKKLKGSNEHEAHCIVFPVRAKKKKLW